MAKRAMHFKFNLGRTKGKGHKQPQSGGGDGAPEPDWRIDFKNAVYQAAGSTVAVDTLVVPDGDPDFLDKVQAGVGFVLTGGDGDTFLLAAGVVDAVLAGAAVVLSFREGDPGVGPAGSNVVSVTFFSSDSAISSLSATRDTSGDYANINADEETVDGENSPGDGLNKLAARMTATTLYMALNGGTEISGSQETSVANAPSPADRVRIYVASDYNGTDATLEKIEVFVGATDLPALSTV